MYWLATLHFAVPTNNTASAHHQGVASQHTYLYYWLHVASKIARFPGAQLVSTHVSIHWL